MAWVFYIADPSDPTYATALVDFMEFYPGGTGFNVADGTLDLGMPDPQSTFLHQPPTAGGVTATQLYPEVVMSFELLCVQTDYDTMVEKLLVLNDALQKGGTIVWQPDGATEARYIDFYPSPLTQLFHGQEFAMQKIVLLLRDMGLPIRITRFPWLRGPDTEVTTAEGVGNNNGTLIFTNPGNAPSPMKVVIDPSGGDPELIQVRMGRKSVGDLADFASICQFDPTPEVTTLAKAWRRLWKQVLVPTTPAGLVGNYRVLCSMRMDSSAEYRFQLRWGNTSEDPMGASNDEVDIDNSDYATWFAHADIPFGKVRYDEDGSSLTLEMWGLAPNDDSPDVDFDTVTLLPADEWQTNLTSPGFRAGKFAREEIWGNMFDLQTTGGAHLMNDDTVRIYKYGDGCRYNLGVLPAGQHVVSFHGHVTRGAPTTDDPTDDVRRTSGIGAGFYVTEDGAAFQYLNLRYLKGEPVTVWDHDRVKRIVFEANGTSYYRVGVIGSSSGVGVRTHVYKIDHWLVPFCDADRVMVMDSYARDAYMADGAGARWLPLHAHGGLMMAAPGDNLMVFRQGYSAQQGALFDADERGALSRALSPGAADITITVTPYYTS